MSRFGKLLRINLSQQKVNQEKIEEKVMDKFVGGKGLGAYYLYKELASGCDPLGEKNKLIFSLGALIGTITPAASRYHLITKSPLTGIFLDCNAGGHFGPELKMTGYDLIIIEGKAEKPVVLYLHAGKVEFLPAAEYMGLGIYETENKLKKDLGDERIHTVAIGPAGENLVRYACIGSDYSRNLGRGGAGAVMGSKNLKAVAVKGSQDVGIDNPDKFMKKIQETKEWMMENPWVESTRKWGTGGNVEAMNVVGLWPVANFTSSQVENIEKINHKIYEEGLVRRLSCANCPVSCSKGYRDTTYTDGEMEGPEYETIALLGANTGIEDPQAIAAANYICNQYGMDTISAGVVIGFIMDNLDKNEITKVELKILPGEDRVGTVLRLLEKIGEGKGVGKLLGKGVKAVAEELGLEGQGPHVKGLELPAYDPRASYGMGLCYQTSDRGACHLRSFPAGREQSGVLSPGDSIEGKAEFVSQQQNEKAGQECLGVCQFPYGIGLLSDHLAELLNAADGSNYTTEELVKVGERVWNLNRCFNLREGISREDDYLPEKFAREPLMNGPAQGNTITYEAQTEMLDEYYELRGWTAEGVPTRSRLAELDLLEIVDDIKAGEQG